MIEITSYGQLLTLVRSVAAVTVIKFYADWCAPCQRLKPEYEHLARLYDARKVVFCSCNADVQQESVRHFAVRSLPTIVVVHNNTTIATIVGGDLGQVQRNIEMAMTLLPRSAPSPLSSRTATDAAAAASTRTTQNAFAEQMMRAARAVAARDAIAEKDACDAAYAQLSVPLAMPPIRHGDGSNSSGSRTQTAGAAAAGGGEDGDSVSAMYGVPLLAYVASDAFAAAAVDALLRNIALRAPPACHDATLLVNQMLRHVIELLCAVTWDDTTTVQELQRMVRRLLQCARVLPLLVASPLFYNDLVTSGVTLERNTLLGALFGVGPAPRSPILSMTPAQRNQYTWVTLIKLFPSAEKAQFARGVYHVQQLVDLLSDGNCAIVRALLHDKASRNATLRYFGAALRLNADYAKTMHHDRPLSSRFFMAQLQAVLVEMALPMFDREWRPSSIPAYYVLDDARNPVVVDFGGRDVERIVHYDTEHPLPQLHEAVQQQQQQQQEASTSKAGAAAATSNTDASGDDTATTTTTTAAGAVAPVEAYKPAVHLFFLAARAMVLCTCVMTDEHERDARSMNTSSVPAADRELFAAEYSLIEGLIGAAGVGLRRLRFLNGLAHWLVAVMRARGDGTLPAQPPAEWQYLPQQLVDAVMRATRLTPMDAVHMDGIIALMLVLMGNTHYFPKAHTHALFPSYLARLMQNQQTSEALQKHAWFASHIVRGCILCYIAVEKSTYERVQVRYELASCIQYFLASDVLCQPVREEFEAKSSSGNSSSGGNNVLERFSHMAVAEVNEAVDQLIETLSKMHQMVKSGANLSEDAVASPTTANNGGDGDNNNNNNNNTRQGARRDGRRRRNNNNSGDASGGSDDDGDDEEDEEDANGNTRPLTYHQLGLGLRSHCVLFTASMDMFLQLAVQFPRGVSQNMVAMQISQMLARSLVTFAGPQSRNLKIEHSERYEFRARDILTRLVRCLTHFRRRRGFMRCLCQCGIALSDVRAAMTWTIERQLVSEDLAWQLGEMLKSLEALSREVDAEAEVWDDAPDFALDALLSTPLTQPTALPADVKSLDDLVYVNRDTLHHLLLSESKHPFTKEYLDEAIVEAFNARPDVAAAREQRMRAVDAWLQEAKRARRAQANNTSA